MHEPRRPCVRVLDELFESMRPQRRRLKGTLGALDPQRMRFRQPEGAAGDRLPDFAHVGTQVLFIDPDSAGIELLPEDLLGVKGRLQTRVPTFREDEGRPGRPQPIGKVEMPDRLAKCLCLKDVKASPGVAFREQPKSQRGDVGPVFGTARPLHFSNDMSADIEALQFVLPRRAAARRVAKDVQARLVGPGFPSEMSGPASAHPSRFQGRGEVSAIVWQQAAQAGFGNQGEEGIRIGRPTQQIAIRRGRRDAEVYARHATGDPAGDALLLRRGHRRGEKCLELFVGDHNSNVCGGGEFGKLSRSNDSGSLMSIALVRPLLLSCTNGKNERE